MSFYLSHSGAYLYYSPHLMHRKNLSQIFRGALGKINKVKWQNYEHIFAENLLALYFWEHVVDEQGISIHDRFKSAHLLQKTVNILY